MANIKLYVFGPPRLDYNGQPIELNLRKAQALLVYLAVNEQFQSRDTLSTLLWPESNQSEGRARLRRTLHRLQHAFGETLLDVTAETIRVLPAAGLWLDSSAFRQHVTAGLPAVPGEALAPKRLAHLEAAVALYHDHFLAGFTLPDSPAFDEWHFFRAAPLCQPRARAGRSDRSRRIGDGGALLAGLGHRFRRRCRLGRRSISAGVRPGHCAEHVAHVQGSAAVCHHALLGRAVRPCDRARPRRGAGRTRRPRYRLHDLGPPGSRAGAGGHGPLRRGAARLRRSRPLRPRVRHWAIPGAFDRHVGRVPPGCV